jgi:hypothetical protein
MGEMDVNIHIPRHAITGAVVTVLVFVIVNFFVPGLF